MNAAEEWGTEVAGEEIERTFKLLNVLAQTRESLSQRELSQELGIALGLVNSYLKRLIRKGYIKVTTLPRIGSAISSLHRELQRKVVSLTSTPPFRTGSTERPDNVAASSWIT